MIASTLSGLIYLKDRGKLRNLKFVWESGCCFPIRHGDLSAYKTARDSNDIFY